MMTEPFGHALSTREGRGYEASGRSYSQAPYLSRTKVPGRTFSPRPGEDRSDVGGAAQFRTCPAFADLSRFRQSISDPDLSRLPQSDLSRLPQSIGPVPLTPIGPSAFGVVRTTEQPNSKAVCVEVHSTRPAELAKACGAALLSSLRCLTPEARITTTLFVKRTT